jgi:hypothetical protein
MSEVQEKSKRISNKEIQRIRELLSDTEKEVCILSRNVDI